DLAIPRFIFHRALAEPDLALQLAGQEQLRHLQHIARYFELVRAPDGNAAKATGTLRNGLRSLEREIDAFLAELLKRPLNGDQTRLATRVLERQYLLAELHQGTEDFVRQLGLFGHTPDLSLTGSFIEALDSFVLTIADAFEHQDPELFTSLVQMT